MVLVPTRRTLARQRRTLATGIVWALVAAPLIARSQPTAEPVPEPRSATPTVPSPPSTTVATPSEGANLGPGEQAVPRRDDRLRAALAPQPGGLTLDAAAREAVATSTSVRAKEAEIEGANGAVTQTLVGFAPRLTLSATYTHLSPIDQPSLGGDGALLGALNPGAVRVGPCPDNPAQQCVVDSAGVPVQAVKSGFTFPVILDQVSLVANVSIPISDYFLRAVQAYTGAQANERALAAQAEAQRLQSAAEAKVALLGWVLARGQAVVTEESLAQANNQLRDARATFEVGRASQADVMRIEALVAQAEYSVAEARAGESLAESRLRAVLHMPAERPLTNGVDVLSPMPAPQLPALEALVREAHQNRLELVGLDESRRASEEVESATRAGYYPRLDAFGDVIVANPNQRIIPNREQFDATWDVGLRLSWTVNETFSTLGAAAQSRARTAQIDAQRQAVTDALRLEVAQAHAELVKSQPSIEAAERGIRAAEEALRVTKKLFAFGSATGTSVADAETALTTARLRGLSARIGLLAAWIRLEHAVGRDRRDAFGPVASRP
jgi:outer membrane protein TolC